MQSTCMPMAFDDPPPLPHPHTHADDYAPPASKSKWFATFYLCIPVGFASGYIVGGLIAPALGWRAAFVLEAAAMLPFVVFALRAEPLALQGTANATKTSAAATASEAASDEEGLTPSEPGSEAWSVQGSMPPHITPARSARQWGCVACLFERGYFMSAVCKARLG